MRTLAHVLLTSIIIAAAEACADAPDGAHLEAHDASTSSPAPDAGRADGASLVETLDAIPTTPDASLPIEGPDAAVAPADASVTSPDAAVAGGDASFDSGTATLDAGAARPDAGGGGNTPLDALDRVTVYLNLGDSVGAGYNAGPGLGYADLLHHNHTRYSSYASSSLRARHPGAQLVDRARSGAKSEGLLTQTRLLPDPAGGDAVVTIHVGGNDFNDDIRTILSAPATDTAINQWTANMRTAMTRLRARFVSAAEGRSMVVMLATIHDPTGGQGSIPPMYNDGFCQTIQNPLFSPSLRMQAIQNLARFNDAIRDFARTEGALLIETHALMLQHGLNAAPAEQWIDGDCAHFNDRGHHELRREVWRVLTGELH